MLAWIVTDEHGVMVEISDAGHRLLNLTARGALGRDVTTFFAGDRHQIFGDMERALEGQVAGREAHLRPRDKRPLPVRFQICREPDTAGPVRRLRWHVEPITGYVR